MKDNKMNTVKQKPYIAIIGPNEDKCTIEMYEFGLELGFELANRMINLLSGGKLGMMEAVFKGAKSNEECTITTVGILPYDEKSKANQYCDIIIPTGIGEARNKVIINTADIVIAISGGAGTLSEMAFAWQMHKPVIGYTGFDGWAKNLAGEKIDNQSKEPVLAANSLSEILEILDHEIKKFQKPGLLDIQL